MNRKNNLGLTLIELLIGIAILGIVSSLAAPPFQKMIERNRLKQAAESLLSEMQLARMQAIKRSQNIIVNRGTGNNGAWCFGFNNTACDCTVTDTTAANYCALKRITGAGFPTTDLVSQSGDTTFNFRRGIATVSNVCLATDNYKIKLLVNAVGKVEICRDTTADFIAGYENCTINC